MGLIGSLGLVFLSTVAFARPAFASDVLTYHNDTARTGQNLTETILTPGNVNPSTFGRLFTITVDGKVDAQPLYVSGVAIPALGAHNVLIVATENDTLYEFDADAGTLLLSANLAKPGETPSDNRGCSQVTPTIGITATPVVDRRTGPNGTIYVVAMSKDSSAAYHQRLHALDLTTLAEEFGGPVEIQATYPGTGDNSTNGTVVFDPAQYKERSGLLLLNGAIYTTWASHCDIQPYTSWVISYNENTLAQANVLNLIPNGEGGGLWSSGAGPAADPGGNMYFLVGNGTFDTTLNTAGFPNQGDYGNAFMRLSQTGSGLSVTDYFDMSNTVAESAADYDLDSGGALVIPPMADAGGVTRRLAVGAGKDRNIYLVDRDNMGKFNASSNNIYQELPAALGGMEFGMPAYFNGRLYYGAAGDVIRAYSFSQAMLVAAPGSQTAIGFIYPGATPSVSANGAGNGILWATENTAVAVLHAYDASNLSNELYNTNMAAGSRDHFGVGNKFITPMIANGKVFVGTTNGVGGFGILPGSIAPVLTSATSASAAVGTPFQYQITATNGPTGFGASGLPAGLVFNSASGLIAGTPTSTAVTPVAISATNAGGPATGTLSLTVTAGLPEPTPRAVFLDPFGQTGLSTYPSSVSYSSTGVFVSNPAVAENAVGDAFVFARDPFGGTWGSVFSATSLTWGSWSYAGGVVSGDLGATVVSSVAVVAARDKFGSYWLTTFQPGTGFGAWTYLGGVFSTDPVLTACANGSVYVVGRDSSGSLWSGLYQGAAFAGWSFGGGLTQGKPTLTCGGDNVAYIAVRDNFNALWMARVLGSAWQGWSYGGGIISGDPQVAAMGTGIIEAVVLDTGGGVWYRGYEEGTANGWQSWVFTGGVVQSASAAAAGGELYIAGRDLGKLWWYQAATGRWTLIGASSAAGGPLATAPR